MLEKIMEYMNSLGCSSNDGDAEENNDESTSESTEEFENKGPTCMHHHIGMSKHDIESIDEALDKCIAENGIKGSVVDQEDEEEDDVEDSDNMETDTLADLHDEEDDDEQGRNYLNSGNSSAFRHKSNIGKESAICNHSSQFEKVSDIAAMNSVLSPEMLSEQRSNNLSISGRSKENLVNRKELQNSPAKKAPSSNKARSIHSQDNNQRYEVDIKIDDNDTDEEEEKDFSRNQHKEDSSSSEENMLYSKRVKTPAKKRTRSKITKSQRSKSKMFKKTEDVTQARNSMSNKLLKKLTMKPEPTTNTTLREDVKGFNETPAFESGRAMFGESETTEENSSNIGTANQGNFHYNYRKSGNKLREKKNYCQSPKVYNYSYLDNDVNMNMKSDSPENSVSGDSSDKFNQIANDKYMKEYSGELSDEERFMKKEMSQSTSESNEEKQLGNKRRNINIKEMSTKKGRNSRELTNNKISRRKSWSRNGKSSRRHNRNDNTSDQHQSKRRRLMQGEIIESDESIEEPCNTFEAFAIGEDDKDEMDMNVEIPSCNRFSKIKNSLLGGHFNEFTTKEDNFDVTDFNLLKKKPVKEKPTEEILGCICMSCKSRNRGCPNNAFNMNPPYHQCHHEQWPKCYNTCHNCSRHDYNTSAVQTASNNKQYSNPHQHHYRRNYCPQTRQSHTPGFQNKRRTSLKSPKKHCSCKSSCSRYN